MTIDRPSPDILVFDPPAQSIKHFRAVHRSLIVLGIILFVAIIAGTIFESILCFELLLRYQIYPTDSKLAIIIVVGLCGVITSGLNPLSIYILLNLKKPTLVQSCTFDRSSGKLSIQQYNLFDRYAKTIEVPLSIIVDIQVRNYPVQLADDFLSISLMTRQSSKPIYIFQRSIPKQIPLPIMKSLLREVEIIRDFLHLPSEPSYIITDRLKWYEVMFTSPVSNDRLRSIEQTNDTLVCNLRFGRYGMSKVWRFDRTTAKIKIECHTLIGKSSKYITRSEIQTIALKTEFLPLESTPYKLISNMHRKEYQKQYSAILIPRDRSSLKPKNGYWRIFTSNDLSMVRDLADRIREHLDLPSEELQSDRAIELEAVGVVVK
jgi:hypothetical protein